jgi:pimeloyl-ACP methyl ester carboxylesterase
VTRVLIEGTAGAFTLFLVIMVGYSLGSFLLARSSMAERQFGVTLREFLRETWLTSITQPLMPFYYVYGDRMASGDGVPIVFVHGYMQNRVGFIGLERLLSRRGLGPMYALNYPWWDSIPANAKRLEHYVDSVCARTNHAAVDLVCHSMGGLVALEMMRITTENPKVRRLVTIATPHAGIAWRGPIIGRGATSLRRGSELLEALGGYKLAVPTLSIFSAHDNIVHPKTTSSLAKRGGEDFEVAGPAHFSILFNAQVADEVAAFLRKPERAPEIEEMAEEIEETPQAAARV